MQKFLSNTPEIGMPSINRAMHVAGGCPWKTDFCKENCYTNKAFRQYHHSMYKHDLTLVDAWRDLTGEKLAAEIARKRNPVTRIRLASRGESISVASDITKIMDLAAKNQAITFWIPTRAWRNANLLRLICDKLRPIKNIRLLASMDPSNTLEDWRLVQSHGFSTMFFGDDELTATPLGEAFFKCPKTWNKAKGFCNKCQRGCFSADQRPEAVHVHLKKH